jgi:hypothetical protein
MKTIFILILAIACSKPAIQHHSRPAPPATSTQKSPFTVEPCYCMKIFKPVCGSDRVTYGNSCEAECKKVSWKDGPCDGQKEP